MVFASGMVCGLSNVALFVLFPSRLSIRIPAPAHSLLGWLQSMDTPSACFPSGHVALPASIAMAAFLESRRGEARSEGFWRRVAGGYAVWTLALAASTLLTKQHFAPDAFAGCGFGILCATLWPVLVRFLDGFHKPTLLALVREWSLVAAFVWLASLGWRWPVVAVCGFAVATRQHALLVLYHDAVHGLVAKKRRWNDLVVNLFVGVPFLLPVHLYRALHLRHHRSLGESSDPERVLLYRGQKWNYRPLPTKDLALQLAGDLFLWNNLAMAWRYFRADDREALNLPRTRAHPELVLEFFLVWGGVLLAWFHASSEVGRILLLWFVPYLTLTQLLQKIRSFAEHVDPEGDASRSCSWEPGWMGRQILWPYHIHYHREHHATAEIPWDRLPSVPPSGDRRRGRDLIHHLWRRS